MQTSHLIYALTVVLVLTGLITMLFGMTGGRKARAGLAFGMGGLFLVVFALLFAFTFYLALQMNSMTGLLGVAQSLGQAPEGSEILAKTIPLSLPVFVLEPVAILLIALGMGALARHSDAQLATVPAGGALEETFADESAEISDDAFGLDDDDEAGH